MIVPHQCLNILKLFFLLRTLIPFQAKRSRSRSRSRSASRKGKKRAASRKARRRSASRAKSAKRAKRSRSRKGKKSRSRSRSVRLHFYNGTFHNKIIFCKTKFSRHTSIEFFIRTFFTKNFTFFFNLKITGLLTLDLIALNVENNYANLV